MMYELNVMLSVGCRVEADNYHEALRMVRGLDGAVLWQNNDNIELSAARLVETVWVLIINHRPGNDITVHASRDAAYAALAAHCRESWSLEGFVEDAPEDDDELIVQYFDQMAMDESYELVERSVQA